MPHKKKKKKLLVFTLLQHKCSNNRAHWLTWQVVCALFVFRFFPLPSFLHFLGRQTKGQKELFSLNEQEVMIKMF